ncbi:MBL fold metallo-hydrolase [Leifsonia shinshuensis]|uniref:MBL fold metallo-hydrolase n=1 Tax=Leifsonia shinshuensis TaxID=150026 RepID=A0A7G6YA70_9MICO|nr:MBL fold metallo-hydrolase [Leifsonia shinshuensis]QNE35385.1 MBL fold metallo-hydrolase [Leifsonia shinshuensis]
MSELTYTILDFADSSLNKTSVFIAGEREAVIVDAAFTLADAHRIVAAALDSGKTPTAVLITAGDPDFYFGAEVIVDAFPGIRVLAPQDVIEHINHSFEAKLQAWAHLGANLPTRLVEIEPFEGTFDLEGHSLELRRIADELGDRGWHVWDPESRSTVGGILLFDGLHVWTADTATTESREAWLNALDAFASLYPQFVAAGHRKAGSSTDDAAIRHTSEYLRNFEKTIAESKDAASAEQSLLGQYPDAGLAIAVNLGTKVAKGELSWG